MIDPLTAALTVAAGYRILKWKLGGKPAPVPAPPAPAPLTHWTAPLVRPVPPEEFPLFTPVRGARRKKLAAAQQELLVQPGPLFELAGLLWPARNYLNKLLLFTGRPGVGKTTMQRISMASVARLFVKLLMRWVVIDPSNAYLPYLYQILPEAVEIIRASPHDAAGWRWDVRADVTNDTLNEAFQTALFPDSLFQKAGDPFWYHKAREVTEAIVNVLHDRHSPWEFHDLVIPIKYPQFLKPLLAQSSRTAGKVKHELVGKLGRDIVTTSSSVINRMATAAAMWRHATKTFSCRAFLNRSASVLHFAMQPDMMASLTPIANALTYMLILLGLERNDEFNHTFFWLDEGRFLSGITGLEILAARGRGSGLGAFLSVQGLPGLFASWGQSRAEELVDVVSAWITFGAGYKTARAFSDFVGQIEGIEKSYGFSSTFGTSVTDGHGTGGSSSPQGGSYSWNKSHSTSYSSSFTNSENFKLTTKDAILPSEVTNLGQATKENDLLSGYAFNPNVGAFRFDVPFLHHFESLPAPPFSTMPIRPDAEQRLDPWKAEDLKRLNLDLTPEFMKALRVTWGHTGGL